MEVSMNKGWICKMLHLHSVVAPTGVTGVWVTPLNLHLPKREISFNQFLLKYYSNANYRE